MKSARPWSASRTRVSYGMGDVLAVKLLEAAP